MPEIQPLQQESTVPEMGVDMQQDTTTSGEKPKPRIRYRVEYRDSKTDELMSSNHTWEPGVQFNLDPDKPAFEFITTYRTSSPPKDQSLDQFFSAASENLTPSYSIHISSRAIINALQRVVKYYPSQVLTGEIVIFWPYPILVHHYDELTMLRDEIALKPKEELCIRERDAYEDLGLILQFLDDQVMAGVNAEKERNKKGYFTYEYAWVSWKPGQTILSNYVTESDPRPQVIHSVTGGVFVEPWEEWRTWAWDLRYDGRYLGRHLSSMTDAKFDGQIALKTFEVESLEEESAQDEDVLNQISYGKQYWKLLRKQCQSYKGRTLSFPFNEVCILVSEEKEHCLL